MTFLGFLALIMRYFCVIFWRCCCKRVLVTGNVMFAINCRDGDYRAAVSITFLFVYRGLIMCVMVVIGILLVA